MKKRTDCHRTSRSGEKWRGNEKKIYCHLDHRIYLFFTVDRRVVVPICLLSVCLEGEHGRIAGDGETDADVFRKRGTAVVLYAGTRQRIYRVLRGSARRRSSV